MDKILDIAGFDITWAEPRFHALLNELVGIEAVNIDDTKHGASWGFKPYPLSRLGYVLDRLLKFPHLGELHTFLEVGCGVGAKLVMARKLFDLQVGGIDYDPILVDAANQTLEQYNCDRAFADQRDATIYSAYQIPDIIWLNRPLWPPDLETLLEYKVMAAMKPGAVLILGNGATTPAWPIVITEVALTAYQKPL